MKQGGRQLKLRPKLFIIAQHLLRSTLFTITQNLLRSYTYCAQHYLLSTQNLLRSTLTVLNTMHYHSSLTVLNTMYYHSSLTVLNTYCSQHFLLSLNTSYYHSTLTVLMCITLTETQHHSLWPTTIQLKLAQHYQNYGSTLVTLGDLFHYYQFKRLFVSIITKLVSAFNFFVIHFLGQISFQ